METLPVLELRGIVKRFGSVEALRGAGFGLAAGEVHGLLGENGAGKSTLMHVAFGLVRPDAGVVSVRGRAVRIGSPLEARASGIGMVHQHFTSIPTLSVAENLRLAEGRRRRAVPGGSADGRTNAAGSGAALELRAALMRGLDPEAAVEDLTVSDKQRVEILQALAGDAGILLLDEPTAVLAPPDVATLLRLLREFAGRGGAVLLISHKLNEVFAAADRVTVLRRGEVVLAGRVAELSRDVVARAMLGGAPALAPAGPRSRGDGVAGEVRARFGSLEARAGDLIGIAAVEGNGQRRLLRSLAGLEPAATEVVAGGPVAFVPEDRTTEGLIPEFTLTENLVLGLADDPRWRAGVVIRWNAARARMAELLDEFAIQAASADARAGTLSGGNQQKVVIARAMERGPRVVVAENPTRGLDLRATAFVHERLRQLADGGALVVVYSTDLDEVLELATRVVVMFRGGLVEAASGASREAIGAMMLGVGA